MTVENIPSRSNGQTILAEWFNTLRSYLIGIYSIPLIMDEDWAFVGDTNTIIVDASSNTVEITLPDAANNIGKKYIIIAKDVTYAVTVVPAAGLIVGVSSIELKMEYESITLITDGVNWYAT